MEEVDFSELRLIAREVEYMTGVAKMKSFILFFFFYAFMALAGIFAFAFGCFMAFTGSPWWGHTLMELILGAGLVWGSIKQFFDYYRGYYED